MAKTSRRTHARLMCGAAGAALLLWAGSAQAETAQKVEIAPQSLASALNEFGVQTGRQVIFAPSLTSAKTTRGVSAEGDIELALSQLLDGSGLTWRRDEDTFLIVRADAPQSGSAAGDGAEGTVEALIVTAQKREEDIQDVPIAISAFTQEQLTDRQVAGGPDLMTQVPNFTFTKTNFSSYSIQIRGIGTQAISATTDPAVAIAFNNTPFVRNRFFEQEFYDLQRVEVLRGPQGTLYGRNATAGVVNIISAKPSFGYEAKLSGDVSNYNSTRLEGMVNLPLVEDVVALRLAGAWTKRDGYVTNEITGNPIDGRDLWSTRVSLRFSPTDRIDANLIWEHFEEDDDRLRSGKQLCHKDVVTNIGGIPVAYGGGWAGPQALFSQGCKPASLYAAESFQTPNGFSLPYFHALGGIGLPTTGGALSSFDPYVSTVQSHDLRVIESTVDPEYRAKTDVVELQVSYDLSDTLTLTSETAWASDFIFSTQDFNRFNTAPGAWRTTQSFFPRPGLLSEGPNGGIFCDPQLGCSDRLVAVDLSTAKSRHFSQEFRLGSNFEGPFNFSLGANFLRYDTEDKYYVFINSLTMYAAISPFGRNNGAVLPPWEAGVSDNSECQLLGENPPDPQTYQTVIGCIYIDPNPIGNLNDKGHNYFLSRNPYKLISYAVFGEAYYNITDNLKVTAGLRWTVDKKEAPRIPSWVLASRSAGYPVMEVLEQEWREPTGRLTIDWKPDFAFTDETLLYGSYAHGYKAGGANPPPYGIALWEGLNDVVVAARAQSATNPKTFDAEFVDAFEVGAKNTFLDGRLTMNLAAFYYDYEGYQISQIVDRSATNLNFDAEVWGLELEADWRPLENLKLSLKLGYEDTKVADGMRAVDLMDRTAGNPDWIVVKPFPSFPSNCIMPLDLYVHDDTLRIVGNQSGGTAGACELSYVLGLDPLTLAPYVPNPPGGPFWANAMYYPNYLGWNPLDESQGHNHGEGFFKDLSGNELPNAPHYTATLTADYTVPLPNDWLATLHTDLYYQSEAWTRIFNMEGYDKLKAYTNVNLAAIFTNEEAGWKVMAYVKNVFDRDSITGAFLNSDDTGLTTNVFLTEPRLYGLRVTKDWNGGPWWTGANPNHTGPYPLTVELGGQVQRHEASSETVEPSFADEMSVTINTLGEAQDRDLDWGDGRELRLIYRPGGLWSISAGLRYGRTNGSAPHVRAEEQTDAACAFGGGYIFLCGYYPHYLISKTNWSDVALRDKEEHQIVDFAIGRDVGLGGLSRSSVGLGVRYAQLKSRTSIDLDTIPDWDIQDGWYQKYTSYHSRFASLLEARREFDGVGPTLSWEASRRLFGDETIGHVDIDWSATGGVLFGKQKMMINSTEQTSLYETNGFATYAYWSAPVDVEQSSVSIERSQSATVPILELSLGLSYEVQRVKIGAGYRWERYFDVLDIGADEPEDGDRTIDGPYLKLSVGFGG